MPKAKTNYIFGDDVEASDLNLIGDNANKGAGVSDSFVMGESITGATTPVPVYIGSDGKLYQAHASDISKLGFIGFVTNSGSADDPAEFQGEGILSGFSGLTAGAKYYVRNTAGTIGVNKGTYYVPVGTAISTSQLLIQKEIKSLRERGLMGESGLVTILGEHWIPTITGGGGSVFNGRNETYLASDSGSSDDDGNISTDGLSIGDTATGTDFIFDLGFMMEVETQLLSITGNGHIGIFIGIAPTAGFSGSDTQVLTDKHIGIFFHKPNSQPWRMYTSVANGSNQTINSVGGDDILTRRRYTIEYLKEKGVVKFLDGTNAIDIISTNIPSGELMGRIGIFAWSEAAGGTARWNTVYMWKTTAYATIGLY